MEQQEDAAKMGDPAIVLGVLSAVERDSTITQRHLARELGIAVGLVNAYVRRCAKKGLLKIRHAPLNRYAYYLTPRGFTEKGRLTAEYLAVSLDFFRRARRDCTKLLADCERRGWRRVALVGAGDLAEIAVLAAVETAIEIVAVIDTRGSRRCAGRPVVPTFAAASELTSPAPVDAIIITDMSAPQACFDEVQATAEQHKISAERILAPELLRISPRLRPAGKALSR